MEETTQREGIERTAHQNTYHLRTITKGTSGTKRRGTKQTTIRTASPTLLYLTITGNVIVLSIPTEMKYLFVLAFIVVYILFGTELGYTDSSPLYTHFTYLFQHASVGHLFINSVSFIVLYTLLQRFMRPKVFLPVSLAIGIIASFFSMHTVPTVGISSAIYAMLGLYLGTTLFDKRIKIADTRRYGVYIGCIAIGLLISYFRKGSNFEVHIISLGMGIIVIFTSITLKVKA